ncbi:hypothetical protein Cflav_PD6125 [Pedosphaera parvula Ellin514]|uniref:Uncharacterized protein n=1 Tax=Pedosphaera parvula (strain Ellin514) TaxID=320771 RepID=B9XP26_PEDPL|nr:hypothetical protein Cflav_PD6125 [Pedosphaera parvula Ellin514]
MKVKDKQAQQLDPPALAGEAGEQHGCQNRAEGTMPKPVVIFSVVKEVFRVSDCIVDDIHNHSKPICVRQNAGQGHKPAVTGIICRFGSDDPTGKQVSNRRHL